MMEANRIWRGLAGETGETDLAFVASACVKLAEDESALAGMEAWRDLAARHQLDTAMLTRAGIAERFPAIQGRLRRRHDDRVRRTRRTVGRGAGPRAGRPPRRRLGRRGLRRARARPRGRAARRRRHRKGAGALRTGRAGRRRVVDLLRGQRRDRPAPALRALHGRAHESGARRGSAQSLDARTRHPPPGRRSLHGLHGRRGGALPVAGLVPPRAQVRQAAGEVGPGT